MSSVDWYITKLLFALCSPSGSDREGRISVSSLSNKGYSYMEYIILECRLFRSQQNRIVSLLKGIGWCWLPPASPTLSDSGILKHITACGLRGKHRAVRTRWSQMYFNFWIDCVIKSGINYCRNCLLPHRWREQSQHFTKPYSYFSNIFSINSAFD